MGRRPGTGSGRGLGCQCFVCGARRRPSARIRASCASFRLASCFWSRLPPPELLSEGSASCSQLSAAAEAASAVPMWAGAVRRRVGAGL